MTCTEAKQLSFVEFNNLLLVRKNKKKQKKHGYKLN